MIDNATNGEWVASYNGSYWQVDSYEDGAWITGVGNVCATNPYSPDSGEQEANANLFSASKEMYDALKVYVENHVFCVDDVLDTNFSKALDAIAKAEGRRP